MLIDGLIVFFFLILLNPIYQGINFQRERLLLTIIY